MMPGLGHVYLQRYVYGVTLFLAFTLLNTLPTTRFLSLPLMVYAAWESYRHARDVGLPSRPVIQNGVFAAVGFVGFFSWFLTMTSIITPIGINLKTTADAARMAARIHLCARIQGDYPDIASDCDMKGVELRDSWGQQYRYRLGTRRFEIWSSGPDGRPGTEDDFVFKYRLRDSL